MKSKDDQYLESIFRSYEPGVAGLTFELDEANEKILLVNDVLSLLVTFDSRDRYLDAKVFSKDRYKQLVETKNPFGYLEIFDQTNYIRNLSEEAQAILSKLEFDHSDNCTMQIYDAFHAFEKEAIKLGENVPHGTNVTIPKTYTSNPEPMNDEELGPRENSSIQYPFMRIDYDWAMGELACPTIKKGQWRGVKGYSTWDLIVHIIFDDSNIEETEGTDEAMGLTPVPRTAALTVMREIKCLWAEFGTEGEENQLRTQPSWKIVMAEAQKYLDTADPSHLEELNELIRQSNTWKIRLARWLRNQKYQIRARLGQILK